MFSSLDVLKSWICAEADRRTSSIRLLRFSHQFDILSITQSNSYWVIEQNSQRNFHEEVESFIRHAIKRVYFAVSNYVLSFSFQTCGEIYDFAAVEIQKRCEIVFSARFPKELFTIVPTPLRSIKNFSFAPHFRSYHVGKSERCWKTKLKCFETWKNQQTETPKSKLFAWL